MSLHRWLSAPTPLDRRSAYHALAAPRRFAEVAATLFAEPDHGAALRNIDVSALVETAHRERCFEDDPSSNFRLKRNFAAMLSLAAATAESLCEASGSFADAASSAESAAKVVRRTAFAVAGFAAVNGPNAVPHRGPSDDDSIEWVEALNDFVQSLDLFSPRRDDRRDEAAFVALPLVARALLALSRELRQPPSLDDRPSTALAGAEVVCTARLDLAVGVAMSLDLLAAFLPNDAAHLRGAYRGYRGIAPGVIVARESAPPLDFHLDLVVDGLGVCYPCPLTMALHPIREDFLTTMHDAWRAALAEVRRAARPAVATTGDPVQNGQWRPSGDPLYDFAWRPTHGPLDVRWRIVGALDGRFTDGQRGLPLRGGSLGLAASGYLARLLAGEWTESNGVADWTGTGVIAEVGAAGRPTRFGEVDDASLSQKVRACLAPGRARRFYVASTQSGLAENFASNCAPAGAPRSPIGKADDLTTLLAAVRTDLGWDRDALSGPSVAVSAISAFITEYTSTEFNPNVLNSGPKPFGGRETQIDDFLTWLRNPHSPRRLLAAASGRGKSALLLHAVLRAMRTADLADVRIAYVPISIRFGTAAREIVVPALADRLRSALGDFSIQHTEAGVADALTRDQPAGRRLLVVLDGIDEAVGWQVTHSLIPPTLGAGVKVFVSARDAETTARDWLTQLGWPAITPAPELPPLDAAGLRDVLLSMGRPLDVHAADDEFLRVLLDLTQGDPLLVRLYVEDLWRTASGGVAINGPQALVDAANSGGVRSGLAGYFDRWWKDQERLWETRGDAAARMDRATRLSDVLSAAFGPLTAEDLAKVLAKFRPLTDERLDSRIVLRQWISDFRRFLTGDGETIGFSFSHPRLKEHFREKGTTSEKRVRHSELQEAFVAWGDEAMWGEDASLLPQPTIERRQASSRLAARVPPTNTPEPEPVQLIAEEASAYLVRHYGEHLEAAERLTDGQRLPRLARLLDDDWCEAWQYVSSRDDYGGYLADVARVARAARRLNEAARSAVPRCSPAFPHFALESRIELIRASIRTLQQKIPPNLVALLFRLRLWTASQTLHVLHEALEVKDSRAAVALISTLSPVLDLNRTADYRLLEQLVAAARAVEDPNSRSRALAAVAERLPPEQALEVAREAMEIARPLDDPFSRSRALAAVAERLPPEQALEVARIVDDPHERSRALAAVVGRLPAEPGLRIAREALEVARSLDSPFHRSQALAAVAERLPPEQALQAARDAIEAARDAIEVARTLDDPFHRSRALAAVAAVAERLPAEPALEVAREALEVARTVANPVSRWQAFAAVAKRLPPEQALEVARTVANPVSRWRPLAAVAERLAPERALEVARTVDDPHERSRALAAVAARLPPEPALQVAREALEAVRNVDDPLERSRALMAVAERLPAEPALQVAREALEAARTVASPLSRSRALVAVAGRLPPQSALQVIREALEAVRSVDDPGDRWEAFAALAERLPPGQAVQVAREAFEVVRTLEDPAFRSRALAALAGRLPSEPAVQVAREALEVAWTVDDPLERSRALAAVAERLPAEPALKVTREALEAARTVASPPSRWRAVVAVMRRLPPEPALRVAREALEVARTLEDPSHRSIALAAVAGRLPPEPALKVAREALEALRNVDDPRHRWLAWVAVAERLPPEPAFQVAHEALEVARTVDDLGDRWRAPAEMAAMAAMAERLPPEQALDVARTVDDPFYRSQALAAVAERLPPAPALEVAREARDVARTLEHPVARSRALAIVARTAREDVVLRDVIWEWWTHHAPKTRSDLLASLEAFLPTLAVTLGESQLQEIADAVVEVGQRWP